VREILQVAREGQLVVIDPRPSVTSRRASLHLKPRPGTDVALLAYLVSEVLRSAPERAASDPLLVPQDVEIVRRAVAPWTRERAASVTGLDAADLHRFRTLLLNAERPLVWSGLGILLGPDGTVGYWLTLVLQAVLGRLDRRGGWLLHGGAVNLPALTRWAGIRGYDTANRSRIGQYPSVLGTWASATLTDDILDPSEDRLRALVVVGGNPAVSLPDSTRAREALSALELLVVLDLRPSQTTALAHAVLPAKSWLARADVGLHQSSTRRRLDLLVSPAVVPGVGQSREDWDILLNLTRAAGKKAFGSWMADLALRASGVGPYGMARALLWGRTLGGIQVDTERGFFGDEAVIGKLRTRGTHRPEGTVKLGVDAFVKALPSAAGLPCPATSHRVLQVITSVRPIQKMNSWISGRHAPSCRLHPLDIARLGGRHIRIRRPGRQGWDLTVTVTADEGLRPGTLVLPWGDPRLDVNAVIGTERLEPFTGQPISNGCWVEVAPDDRSERHVDPL
jgi:anaerobic selenocysteine-containing dehydrogenase